MKLLPRTCRIYYYTIYIIIVFSNTHSYYTNPFLLIRTNACKHPQQLFALLFLCVYWRVCVYAWVCVACWRVKSETIDACLNICHFKWDIQPPLYRLWLCLTASVCRASVCSASLVKLYVVWSVNSTTTFMYKCKKMLSPLDSSSPLLNWQPRMDGIYEHNYIICLCVLCVCVTVRLHIKAANNFQRDASPAPPGSVCTRGIAQVLMLVFQCVQVYKCIWYKYKTHRYYTHMQCIALSSSRHTANILCCLFLYKHSWIVGP